jgi:outer membrane protein TolC
MRTTGWTRTGAVVAALGVLWVGAAGAAVLTADDAVKIALQRSGQIVNANAGILDARGSLRGAYGGLLPSLSLSYSRAESRTTNSVSSDYVGGVVFPSPPSDLRNTSTTPSIGTTWGVLNLSSWAGLSAARQGLRASRLQRDATRSDVALATRREFYAVVQAIKLAEVSAGALHLASDDERRVKAMFEVGSVSKSDLLKAQVRTAQSEFDLLAAQHAVTVQRVALATQMGIRESELGEVDTLLVATPQTFDEPALLSEAAKNRPDLIAAEAELKSARASLASARMARLPYVTASGSATFSPKSTQTVTPAAGSQFGFGSESDRSLAARVTLSWDVFNLGSIEARIMSARARVDRAREAHDALQRNLASEVHQQILAYTEAVEQDRVAERGLESAVENLKLTQEKYNVGSSTILELIDAQVQLQTAQSNVVKALAAIRVAEAQINRVRGHGE